MNFDFLNHIKEDGKFLNSTIADLSELREKLTERLENINVPRACEKNKDDLYYVYAYSPEKVYITKQNSTKLELLKGVTDEFKQSLAEGFILRRKNGKFTIDEKLTEKSMNFELDFDNYKE